MKNNELTFPPQEVANRLLQFRLTQDLTPETMAKCLNVPVNTLLEIEQGNQPFPSEWFAKLDNIMGMNTSWLLFGHGPRLKNQIPHYNEMLWLMQVPIIEKLISKSLNKSKRIFSVKIKDAAKQGLVKRTKKTTNTKVIGDEK